MFFVVYFKAAEKHLVVPKDWIYNSNIVLEKFINYSLNPNQTHLCYYAKEGFQINMIQPANFNCLMQTEFPFDADEGYFEVNIIKYCSKYPLISLHYIINNKIE